MLEEVSFVLDVGADSMKKAISHLEAELVKIRAGRATPQMLDGLVVDYYGSPTPISQVGNISVADARTITIQPWEKNMLQPIERSIIAANIGVTPQNDGMIIRLFLPPLTEERRKDLVKRCKTEGENAKISLRSIRKEANDAIKKELKKGITEDEAREAETKIQLTTDGFISKVDKHLETKEKEVMTV